MAQRRFRQCLMHNQFVSEETVSDLKLILVVVFFSYLTIIIHFSLGRQLVLCIRASLVEMPSKQMEQFNGYIVSLLVIFYFQNRKLLPPVRELEENCDNSKRGDTKNSNILPLQCHNSKINYFFFLILIQKFWRNIRNSKILRFVKIASMIF